MTSSLTDVLHREHPATTRREVLVVSESPSVETT